MTNYKVEFSKMEWIQVGEGVEQKQIIQEGQQMRLVRFHSIFREQDWCKKAHLGYVLEGEMNLSFNGKETSFLKGEAFAIPEGEAHQHRLTVTNGRSVDLLLFEAL